MSAAAAAAAAASADAHAAAAGAAPGETEADVLVIFGITYFATHLHIAYQTDDETVLSQVSRAIYGSGWLYYSLQAATCGILIIAGPPLGAPGAANLLRLTHAPRARSLG